MNLYLLRHANALNIGEQGVQTDEDRPLSGEGRERVALLAGALQRLGLSFDCVLSSPLRRSMETAEELLRQLGLTGTAVTPCDRLGPAEPCRKLGKGLLTVESENVLLVGHEPDLSRHAAWLIGSKKAHLEFAKGGMALIRCDGAPQKGAGTLVWLITPKWLAPQKVEIEKPRKTK
jgi:phosphohistidine phosphatase